MSKKETKRVKVQDIFIVLALFILLTTLSLIWVYKNYYNITWKPANLTETTDTLPNPDCGWYRIYGYTLSDDSNFTLADILENCKSDTDTRLALLEINLKNYRTGSISDFAITQLDTLLSSWQKTNKKLIIRFLYDWNGLATETEPDDISIILKHMEQVASVINNHAADIYTLQGIFVGNVGEMNNSKYMSEQSMVVLMKQLVKVTAPSIYLSVRTPAQWRQITSSFHPLARKYAFLNTIPARIGLFNDGMLGSGNDCGTYGDISLSKATKYSDKGTRSEELDFQNTLCRFVPNGGEVILDNPYNDLNAAISDLYKMHVSYLNNQYDPNVLEKWKSTIYSGKNLYNGLSGYEFISKHLGYRYVLRSTGLTFHTFKDQSAAFDINIENIGFANCYKKYEVTLNLKNKSTGKIKKLSVDTDTRDWLSNEVMQLNISLALRSYEIGTYEIYFSIKDPASKETILLANKDYDSKFGYYLGSLTLKKFS